MGIKTLLASLSTIRLRPNILVASESLNTKKEVDLEVNLTFSLPPPKDEVDLEVNLNFSLIFSLPPQEVCVEAYNWDSMLLLNTCRTVVGSEQFPGLRESLHYYEDHADEFVGSDAMHLLWSRMGALQGGDAPFALVSIGARSGGQLQARYFLQRDGADRPTHLNVTAAEALVVCLGAGCSGEHDSGVFRVSPDGTQQRIATITRDTPLDTVWAQHGAREGNELRAFEIDASVPAPHELVDALSNTLAAAEPVLLLVFWHCLCTTVVVLLYQ